MFYSSSYERKGREGRAGRILFTLLLLMALGAYMIFATRHMDEVPSLTRSWAVQVGSSELSDRESDRWLPFIGEEYFGYLSPRGDVLYREEILFHVAVSEGEHVNYSRMGESLVSKRPAEDYFYRIDGDGYPVYRNGNLFLVSHDRMSIMAVGDSGERLFQLDFPSIVTSFDTGPRFMVVGLLNGRTEVFDLSGAHLSTLQIEDSNRPVYGVAVSANGSYMAVLWGDGPQHLSLYRNGENTMEEVARFSREEAILWEGLLRFSRDEQLLLYESTEGISVIDIEAASQRHIRFPGSVFDLHSEGRGGPIFVAGNSEKKGFIRMYTESGRMVAQERLSTPIRHVYPYGEGFICTSDGVAMRVEGKSL